MNIPRHHHRKAIETALSRTPVVVLLGARQVGKTTLANEIADAYTEPTHRFDLEDMDDLARLAEPKLALAGLSGLVVIDEIQRRPDLFQILRVLADRPNIPARFLLLGSAQPALLRQSSETLAGRVSFYELGGFDCDEVGHNEAHRLWLRGGFPRAFLAKSESASIAWRRDFVRTFLEQDLPQLGISIPATTLHRFWKMLAHYHGQTWNGAELARAFGVAQTTVRRYLDILTSALVVRQLQPWHENLGKRQVKSPKVYLSDTGLLHHLLGIVEQEDLESHPKVGASWEGFVIHEIIRRTDVDAEACYFWGTHSGAELDLLVMKGSQRLGFEIKRTTAPRITASMRAACDSLKLDKLTVIHAGQHAFSLGEGIEALPFDQI